MSPRALDLIGTLARLGLAAVFLISGYLKAVDLDQTYVAVQAYQVLPKAAIEPVSVLLPWFEIALGALVLVGVGTRLVGVISAGLMLVFITGVAQAWARGLNIDCGCFGGGGQVAPGEASYGTELLRDTGFLALAVWLIVRPTTLFSLDERLGRDDVTRPPKEAPQT